VLIPAILLSRSESTWILTCRKIWPLTYPQKMQGFDMSQAADPLRFRVAPHIIQDFGLNLYSDLSRVLVEYIANAYDADATYANVLMDKEEIDKQRNLIKKQFEVAKQEAENNNRPEDLKSLEEWALPDEFTIIIQDDGCGMARDDLDSKFLIAGRRRRQADGEMRSAGGRILMRRKGLGKLAGFGAAKEIVVITRNKAGSKLTQITLSFDDLIADPTATAIEVPEETIDLWEGFPDTGTRIILRKLLYGPLKTRLDTIERRAASYFWQVEQEDFILKINGDPVDPEQPNFAYAWPDPDEPLLNLSEGSYVTEDGIEHTFKYRLRFVADRQALGASERGIRVYCHNRLASAPSLLKADTNMHGFRMTDYLDGVVYADFIDDQENDYIATDRQSLRWESPLLQPLFEKLSEYITLACAARQKVRDQEKEDKVRDDEFTNSIIDKADLTKKETEAAYKIARALASLHKQGLDDGGYKEQFKEVVEAVGRGDIVATLANFAAHDDPELKKVVAEIAKLTANEIDSSYKFARARIFGIQALRKIVESTDFKKPNNEHEIHKLLNECPWLIRPSFFRYISSDESEKTLFINLSQELGIGTKVPGKYDKTVDSESEPGNANLRPDLVFLLGNETLTKIVVVELKAPNTPLHGEHYRQLQGYLDDCRDYLKKSHPQTEYSTEGILIGTRAKIDSKAKEVKWLDNTIEDASRADQRIFIR